MKGRVEALRRSLLQYQRTTFLLASGLSTAGSFAGLTAKGWILMDGSGNALILAIHFAALALPSLLVSGAAGVATDRLGSETVLVRAQWALFGAGLLGAIAIPLTHGGLQMGLLLLSTLLVGVAIVPPCGDPWLDRLLGLPDEALAMLRCSFKCEP